MATRRQWLKATAGSALASALTARAQNGKVLKIIVPFAAGGPIDLTTRLLAEQVKEALGPVVVENRPGAGGNIGLDMVAKAVPDGWTLGIAAVAMQAINPWLFRTLPFDPLKDFAPITQMVRVPNVLVVNAQVAQRLKIATLADFIAYAKAHPGKLSYGSGGNGSAGHLGTELFKSRAGIFAVHIPYGGGAPAQLALLSQQVDFTLDNLATAATNIKAGKIVALAVSTAQRSPLLPGVPAIAERYPGFEIDTWWGLTAPVGTPAERVQRLSDVFGAALASAEIKTRFAQAMAEPVASTPEAFRQFIAREHARYGPIVKASGATID
jgi:tripartite-type tricarboxylate transporter receptor subunit TctC